MKNLSLLLSCLLIVLSFSGCGGEEADAKKGKKGKAQAKPYMEPYNNGLAEMEEENYKRAVKEFTNAIAKGPDFQMAWYQRGICYGKLRNDSLAVDDFSRAIEIKPDDPESWYQRGLAYLNARKYSMAIEDLSQANILNPGHEDVVAYRGIAYVKSGDLETGCPELQAARKKGSEIAAPFIKEFCK